MNMSGALFQALNSTAVIISIPLSSKADVVKMEAWENRFDSFLKLIFCFSFIKFMKRYKHDDIQLSFMAERSIQVKREDEEIFV